MAIEISLGRNLVVFSVVILLSSCTIRDRTTMDAQYRRSMAEQEVGRTMIMAIAAQRSGDYKAVVTHLANVIEKKVDRSTQSLMLLMRGESYGRMYEFEKSIADFEAAQGIDPSHSTVSGAALGKGVVYGVLGQFDRAFAEFETVIRSGLSTHVAYRRRGDLYLRQGDFPSAIAEFGTAIRLRPDFALAHLSRGIAFFLMGDFKLAATDFARSVEQDQKDIAAKYWLYLARNRNSVDGTAEMEKATRGMDLDVWPAPVVKFLLGRLTSEVLITVAKDLDQRMGGDRECQAYFYVGQQLILRGDSAQARRMFDLAVQTKKNFPMEYLGAREELRRSGKS